MTAGMREKCGEDVRFPGTSRPDAGAILLIAASSLTLLRSTNLSLTVSLFALRSCPLLWPRIIFLAHCCRLIVLNFLSDTH